MKLRLTRLRSQVILTSIALIAISMACSASKSAESPTANAVDASTNQPLTSPSSSITQDKQPCTLTLSAVPGLNGIRLGMTPADVLALFPGSKDDAEVRADLMKPANPLGTSTLLIRSTKYETNGRFEGIKDITLKFLDGRVSGFTAAYNGPEYAHVDMFVKRFVEGTNLPNAAQWEAHTGLDNQLKVLKCAEFEVRVFAGGPGGSLNYVQMQDVEADKKLKERRRKAREQASATPVQ